MGLLYAWATPQYLLWEMSIGQIIMYHHYGLQIKYPQSNKINKTQGLTEMTPDQLKQWKEKMRVMYGEIEKNV